MKTPSVGTKTSVGVDGEQGRSALYAGSLNERLFEIGLWLTQRDIPHLARILMEPEHGRIRLSFADSITAEAFRDRFGPQLNTCAAAAFHRHRLTAAWAALDPARRAFRTNRGG